MPNSPSETSPPAKRLRSAPDGASVDQTVPVIDIAPFLAADTEFEGTPAELPEVARNVARRWRHAFSTQGFAQVEGHGVPDEAIEDAYRVARNFFSLPAAEKKRCDLGLGYGAGGYSAQGVERVSATASRPDGSQLLGAARARPPDRVESMIVKQQPTDVVPDAIEGYTKVVYRYHDEIVRVLRCIMRLTACSLDLPMAFFEPYFFGADGIGAHSFTGDGSLRLAYYPAFKEGDEPPPGQLRYGEHTDYTGFTILWQDHNTSGPQTASDGLQPPDGGLQVQLPGGSWVDCPPVPRAFTVNAGDLIQVWTNDMFLSNTHRVKNPPPGDRHDRISLVFFTGPTMSTLVEALPTCCGPDRPRRYTGITAREHLNRKLAASNR